MPDNLGKAVLDLGANLKGLNAGLDQAKTQTSLAMGRMKAIGIAGVIALGTAVAAFGAQSVAVAGNFEAGMKRVQAFSGATTESLQRLEDQAKQLGATTEFSAIQATDAMYQLSSAGLAVNQVMETLPHVLNTAASAQIGLEEASKIVTGALKGFNLAASEAQRVSDVLVVATQKTKTSLPQMGEALKEVAGVANTVGHSLEGTTAVLGELANANYTGSQAGVALASAITRLIKPTGEAKDALTKLQVQTKNSDGSLRGFNDIMRDLRDSGAGTAEVIEIFGQEAGRKLAGLLDESIEAVDSLEISLSQSEGAAKETAKIMNEGLNGALKSLGSSFESLQIAIADAGLLDFATDLIELTAKLTRGMAKLVGSVKSLEEASRGLDWGIWNKPGWSKEIDKTTDSLDEMEDQIKKTLAKAMPKATHAIEAMTAAIKETGKVIPPVVEKWVTVENHLKNLADEERKAGEELLRVSEIYRNNLAPAIAGSIPPTLSLADNTVSLNERFNEVAGTLTNTTAPAIGTFTDKAASQFENFANSVDHELSTLSGKMVHALITGDTSFAKAFKTMTTNLATSFLTDFINIATKSVTEFVTNILKGQLLKSLSSVIGKLGDLKGAASSALSVAGGAAGQVGGAIGGGGVGQAATSGGGGALGIVGAVTGVVSAISSIIGNFQQRTTNDRLLAIATNTKFINDRLDITNNHFLLGIWTHLVHTLPIARTTAMATHLKNTDMQLTRIASQATKRDTTLERIARLEEQQLGKLDAIATKVGQPQTVVISSEDPDKFGERVSESIRLNRGGLRETVEDLREEGAPA